MCYKSDLLVRSFNCWYALLEDILEKRNLDGFVFVLS